MMDQRTATRFSFNFGVPVRFEEFDETGLRHTSGTVHPCGCLEFSTVLLDGSLGWGGWDELCPNHFFENQEV